MTEDYKQALFKYLTGNLISESEKNEETIREVKENLKNHWIEYLPEYNGFQFNGLIQSNTNDLLVLYGEYIEKNGTEENNSRGIIILLDNNFNPLKSIYEYENGAKLRPIQHMIQVEDGTFVAVDSKGYSTNIDRSTNARYEKRFIMLNNITIRNEQKNDYVLNLRQSYIFSNDYKNFRCVKIYKNPNSAHYVMMGLRYIDKGTTHYDGVSVIDLKINVGSTNEWSVTNDNDTNWLYGGSYCEFNDDDEAFWEIVLTHNISVSTLNLWAKDYNTNIFVKTIMTGNAVYVDSVAMNNQCVFISKDELYFVVNNERWGSDERNRHLCLYKYNNSNNELKVIKNFDLGIGDWYKFRDSIFLDSLDNKLYINYCTNVDIENYTADYYFQRLEDDVWAPILIESGKPYSMEYRYFYISKSFNLLSGRVFSTILSDAYWYFGTVIEVYNPFNYNGLPFKSENSLIPNSVEVYSNNNIVFARNIHNLSINDNMTISSVEIPNNYLNDIDLTGKDLVSKTNFNLINNDNMFQKNIYETVFLNFINSIQVIDENNNHSILNRLAGSYINNAVNTTNSYDRTKLYERAILHYKNGAIKEILYEYQNRTKNSVNIVFLIYADAPLDKIELVSNNKIAVYQTIDLSNLEVGKIYNIKQKMEVV